VAAADPLHHEVVGHVHEHHVGQLP
jgi:hypothetical protein